MQPGRVSFCAVILLVCGGAASAADGYAAWSLMPVPGTWDEHSHGELADYDGFAWYRCQVVVPAGWKGQKTELLVPHIDNAHEAYFNGVKIGGAGAFPPDYKSGLSEESRYVVPAEAVRFGFGDANVVSLRVFDHDGRGGFKGIAPVLTAGKNGKATGGIALNGTWEFRTGDDVAWAKGPIEVTETAIFWRVMPLETARDIARRVGSLDPASAAKTFTVPDDLELEQVLAEPQVRQPVAMHFDERGRLWVVNYLQYPYPAGLKMVSKDEFWRAVYDKIPEPPPHGTPGTDTITIHEDTDGDGRFDRHKTFLDNLNIASSVLTGRGGVWVLNPPYLLFYPDRNGDDVPDSDPEVHLQGFGMEDTHSVANSLTWGPDGWIYAGQGSTVSGNVKRYGTKDKPVYSQGQLIWRYHPERRQYEVFAEGGGNTWCVEWDTAGRTFSGHNGGDTRGFHYVQGGYSQKGFGKHGPLSNPYAFGYFGPMKHHSVPRFTHNWLIYEADALPARYRGHLFGVEPLQGRVVESEIFTDGSTFATKDLGRPVSTTDPNFRPVDIKTGPDGAIYIADMYEPQISHREHFSGQIDKSTGRVYRLKAKGAAPLPPFDLRRKTSRELVELLDHPNKWFRQTALRVIGDRRDQSIIPLLKERIAASDGQTALECLWALHLCGGLTEGVALELLEHPNPYVRQWTVRLMCDGGEVASPLARKLAQMAEREPSVYVRSQLASSARRLSPADGLPVLLGLMTRSEDVNDPHLPLLVWWGIEAQCGRDSQAVLALLRDRAVWRSPLVEKHILSRLMQRFAMAGSRHDLLVCAQLFGLAPDQAASAKLMQGFEAAFKGRPLTGLPPELLEALAKAGGGSPVLGIRQGRADAVESALKTIADERADKATRIEYIQALGEVDQPTCVPVLLALLDTTKEETIRQTALTALGHYGDENIGRGILAVYVKLPDATRTVAQNVLVSRAAWSRALLEAVDAGTIAADSLSLDLVRQMTFHRDERVAELLRKHWKNLDGASTAEMQQQIARAQTALRGGTADPRHGKTLYMQTCGKCHILFGEGGRIGPELTTYKRDDIARILVNVVNPSAEIREGFESVLVLTDDGRTAGGFLFDQDNRVVVLRGIDGQNVTIPRDHIEELLPQKKSLMPEGLLKNLTEQEVRDLFAYLRSSQPLN